MNPAAKNAPFDVPPELRKGKFLLCPFEWGCHWGHDSVSPLFHQPPEFRLLHDIAICKVREHPMLGSFQPLNIGLSNLAVGDRAVAIGYAEMRNIRLGGDDYEPELIVSVGTVTSVFPNDKDDRRNSTPGPNFEFDAKIPGKMSGSPILVGEGILAKGVVSRSWQNENLASGCLIPPIMGLPVEAGKSLLDLQHSGNEGIAKLMGPDL